MKRHTNTILAAVSLLLCVIALGAWVRSHLGRTTLIGSIPGALAVGTMDAPESMIQRFWGADVGDGIVLRQLSERDDKQQLLGFTYASGNLFNADYWLIAVPYWLIVPLTAILPVRWWLLRRRRRVRIATGRCLGCGYDLRDSAERCPECGAPNLRSPAVQSALP